MVEHLRRLFQYGTQIRIVGVLAVFVLTLMAFSSGVGTRAIPSMNSESFLGWLYFAGSLFVFGGTDLGSPLGGPSLARAALWVAYFLAPAITTTAVADALLRLVRPGVKRSSLRDHVLLVGTGQLAAAYLSAIRTVEPSRPVLLIEQVEGQHSIFDSSQSDGVLARFRGDLRDQATLQTVGVDQASRMIVITSDDLVNLECAWAAKTRCPDLPVAVHVSDLNLLRPVKRLTKPKPSDRSKGTTQPMVFSMHRIAALHLYEQFLDPHFEQTSYQDVMVIAGFGRLGQTILELLIALAAKDLQRVVVVDPDASRMVRQFMVDVDMAELGYDVVDGSLDDPRTWREVADKIKGLEALPVYFLASSEQVVNFRAAMLLRGQSGDARIFVRCFHRSEFAESLAHQLSIELLTLEDVLRDALQDHYEALASI